VKLAFHPGALAEYQEAAHYYAAGQKTVAIRFIAAIETVLDHIEENPQWGRILDGNIRRSLARVFPYAVLYSIESDYILVIAIMHCHREPGYWHHRTITNK
jgi:toxin ParE1/3/4